MSVRRNAAHALAGFVVPTLVVLACYRVLVGHLGTAAFGVYLLAATLNGTMMFLDFGFAAAATKFVAEDLAAGRLRSAADVLATSVVFYGAMGIAGCFSVMLAAPWLAGVLRVDARLMGEAVLAFRLAGMQFALFLPMTVFLSAAKGMQRFHLSTLFVSLLSTANYGGAVVAVTAGWGLTGAVAAGVVANAAALIAATWAGLRLCHARGIRLAAARPTAFRRMFNFAWVMTVNSVSGFLLVHIQRYLVAMTMGPAAVSIYQTAAVAPSKVHAAVNAGTEVMFPFSSEPQHRAHLRSVYVRMLGGSAVLALGGFTVLATCALPLLTLWVGAPLARSAAPLVPVFALGYLFLSLSPAPFHLVNGLGRPGLNTVFYAVNALLNTALIGIFAIHGLTLAKFAWAFAAANSVTSVLYQASVEAVVWRAKPRLREASA